MKQSKPTLRLGVNIDHVATLRNARGGAHPCPIRAAQEAKTAGADGITAHLREDRRHIRDHDIERLKAEIALPLNLEMAVTDEMIAIALRIKPHACCLVPEKRAELTTEGGLDVVSNMANISQACRTLSRAGIRVSLFIDPAREQIEAAHHCGAAVVELHTGTYCEATGKAQQQELQRLRDAASHAAALGLEVHAGHGLNYGNTAAIAAIPQIVELNIGHFLMGEALFAGLGETIRRMRRIMEEARA